ncbi:hypothetical protein ABIE44_000811 [Marmoricola sp. OAE513]|uniref:hypothetical protein n=1 Tax=Marmoricola sp. OAE513 TaxID=2817894 RepID=UPI001AE49BBD
MHALPAPQLITALVENLDDQLLRTGTDRAFVIRLCSEAIGFSWTLSKNLTEGHVGQRARNSASLLLELGCPEVSTELRERISVACEVIAVGARTSWITE